MSADGIAEGLAGLERDHLLRHRRVLDSPAGACVTEGGRSLLNFASNDYLGLANHPRLREAACRAIDTYGVGSGASPLVTGHTRIHEDAETRFAAFVGLPRALLFASGYAANLGILASFGDRSAEILADRLNHACLNDGAILSRATFTRYAHRDMQALANRLAASTAGVRIVATDAVFSMDGDIAPVAELATLCERHDAWLVLDDAHGIGVLGAKGRGTLEHFGVRSDRILYMATLGKALGGYGAFVAGNEEAIEWLMQRARTYIYSTALPPMAAGAAIAALDLIDGDPGVVRRLQEHIARFVAACKGIALAPSITAIQPVVLGDNERTLAASAWLREQGFLVPAIRPPTVPQGSARLRVSLSAAHTREDVDALAGALSKAVRQ